MRVLILIGLLFHVTLGHAADLSVLEKVNSLHSAGQTAEALDALEASALKGEAPGLYYYNRGVLQHSLARYGLAVASFEKAKSLARGRAEVEQALQTARMELSRTLGPARLDQASSTLEKIGDEMPFEPFLVFFAGLTLLGVIVVIVRKMSWTSRIAILAGVNGLLFLAFLIWMQWMRNHPPAVVIEASTIRSGPGTDFLDLSNLDVGMKVRSLESSAGWLKVRYGKDGEQGYLPAESLLLLVE